VHADVEGVFIVVFLIANGSKTTDEFFS